MNCLTKNSSRTGSSSVLTTEIGWQLFGGHHILNDVLVDAPGLYQVTHAHRHKEVPRHACVKKKKVLVFLKSKLNLVSIVNNAANFATAHR